MRNDGDAAVEAGVASREEAVDSVGVALLCD